MLKVSVFLDGVKLLVKCGVYREERELGVQLKVSVKVTSEKFVDYQELYELLLETACSRAFKYMEEFGQEFIGRVVENWSPESVIMKIVKVSVPFQHSFNEAGVELVWRRVNE